MVVVVGFWSARPSYVPLTDIITLDIGTLPLTRISPETYRGGVDAVARADAEPAD